MSTSDAFFSIVKPTDQHNFKSAAANDKIGIAAADDSDYKSKMKKLNGSILSWMDRQIVEHPLSIWKDGLKVTNIVFEIKPEGDFNPFATSFLTHKFWLLANAASFYLKGLHPIRWRYFREISI